MVPVAGLRHAVNHEVRSRALGVGFGADRHQHVDRLEIALLQGDGVLFGSTPFEPLDVVGARP